MRTRVFIDGQMLHRTSGIAGYDVDFKRLREFYFPEASETVALTFYNIEMIREDGTSSLRKLIDWLEPNGYRCRILEVQAEEKNSVRDARPELLVWMAADILNAAENGAERIVVWCGDRALIPALRGAQEAGAVIEIVANSAAVGSTLRRVTDSFVELADMRESIELLQKASA